jgi:hypothetical protein
MPRASIKDRELVPIVKDGAIGNPDILGGRIIPVLIIDCSSHRQLGDLIVAHEHTPPGDVVVSWGWKLLSRKTVFLTFRFSRPMETVACVAFDVVSQGGLVEWIVNARGVYLQPLSSGQFVSAGLDKPKILVEVPASATFPIWKELHRKALEKQFRKRGFSRDQAREAVREHLARMHDIQFRRPPREVPGSDA